MIFFSTILILWSTVLFAEDCRSSISELGVLPKKVLKEVSGMDMLGEGKNAHWYFINDTQYGDSFYRSNYNYSRFDKVSIKGVLFEDVEDLSVGKCFEQTSCLIIGDIGDNDLARKRYQLYYVNHPSAGALETGLIKAIHFKYADKKSHNAETLFTTPSGDIIIATKPGHGEKAGKTNLYHIPYKALLEYKAKSEPLIALYLGTLDLSSLRPFSKNKHHIITAGDMSADGQKWLLLSKGSAYEFFFSPFQLKNPNFKPRAGIDFRYIRLQKLQQQEAIALVNGGEMSFHYTTERKNKKENQPILRGFCP